MITEESPNQEQEIQEALTDFEPVNEPEITFKINTDRNFYQVRSEKNNEVMLELSGYDIHVMINMDYINNLEDVEAACGGVTMLVREAIIENLFAAKQAE